MNKIGEGSEYDIDMELIESFVRCNTNRNSTISVFEYYTSRLRSYWEKCKENIDILSQKDNGKRLLENMNDYENIFSVC